MASEPDEAPYPQVDQQPDFPALEEQILEFWRADGTFPASVAAREAGPNEYVFYDGPPFANGLPHYGHLLTGFVKDAVPRYRTMRGRRVERRFGWDCHGLPAEMVAEKELGVSGRAGVTAMGIGQFNEHCRSLVLRTADEWERYVTRQARWVDFGDDYKTMDLPYMESVLWAFRQLWDKGLIYEGYRVLPYCWECETPLSNFETRQDDAYRPREDPAVTVAFELDGGPAAGAGPDDRSPSAGALGPGQPLRVLVWTTTPWTLPSNLALVVGPDFDYAVFELDGARYVVGAARAEAYAGVLGDAVQVGTVKGSELVGRTYRPLFDFFADAPNAFRVLAGDFVSTDEGTGIVHVAPGFGEDDQRVSEANGIAVVSPVDDRGRFTAEVPPYAGLQVLDANEAVIDDLAASGALLARENYVHSYPHCWRTDTPLIYRAVSSWFVRVTAFRDRMVELNKQIRWTPAHVRDGAFGKWLEGARDWSISRNRFWGAPIPVWKSDDPRYPRVDVYGSLDEIERDFGVRPSDLHRPAVDELTRPNPDDPTGASVMRRVDDVLDCWFESGSMPYAQLHYPMENRERFESHFPADFIVEYVSQTRGWFYTLHVLSTALFDCPPFKSCIAHGVVLGHDGRKMSKRLSNYPEANEVFTTYGADAMRWFLLSSAVLRGQDQMVDHKGFSDAVRQILNPIWNAWYFLTLYANTDRIRGHWRTDATGVLDRYALAKTAALVDDVTTRMEADDLPGACAAVAGFLDAFTNWYIRRSRDRFWKPVGDDPDTDRDKRDAYDTLATVLQVLCQVAAPLLPLVTEAVYRGLTGERSVHLTDWPAGDALPADPALVADMDLVREVASAAHSVRKANDRRARLPLASLTVAARDARRLEPFVALIADEVNVQRVHLSDAVDDAGEMTLSVDPSVVGPRLGADTQTVLAAARKGNWSRVSADEVEVGGTVLHPGEFSLRLKPRDEVASRSLPGNDGVVTLDLEVTPALARLGLARDLIRTVQMARRDAGLHVADHIRLVLDLDGEAAAAVESHRRYLMEQTLTDELDVEVVADSTGDSGTDRSGLDYHARHQVGRGRSVGVGLSRIA